MRLNFVFISRNPYPEGLASTNRIRIFTEYLAKKYNVTKYICSSNNAKNDISGENKNVKWKFIRFSRIEYIFNLAKIYNIIFNSHISDSKNILMLYDGISLANFWFALFAKIKGFKIITDIVEDYSYINEKQSFVLEMSQKFNTFFDRFIDFFTDRIIVISSRLYIKYYYKGINKKKLCIIPISATNLDVKIPKKQNDKFTFIYSGSFGNKDGIKYMISAFEIVSKNNPNCRLFLSGKINNYTKDLISNKKNIYYKGMLPNKKFYNFLSSADVLLMTRVKSKYADYGFPFKLGEYLATANPVITTDVSDVKNFLSDGVNALIAKPSCRESLVEKMTFAINCDKSILNEIGNNGKIVCNKYFNPNTNGQKLAEFINKLF